MSWNDHYLTGETPWDIGRANPVVLRGAEALDPGARIVVPGCGRGWEVEALAVRGHRICALDVAPAALDALGARLDARGDSIGARVDRRVADVLDPPAELVGAFDGWAEHTCFCALEPTLWPAYVASAARLLRPGGLLFGAFLHFDRAKGPPHGTNPDEVRALFEKAFEIEHLASAPETFEAAGVPQLEARFRRRP